MTTTVEPFCTALPLEAYPSMNPLALDLVRREAGALRFFESGAYSVPSHPDRHALAAALRESNDAWDNHVEAEIDAWERKEADVIIAGQQVGFGGGPLYTLVKLASLVHLKRRAALEGRRLVAFFWMATEDHDFDEVARLTLQIDGRPREYRSMRAPAQRFPVGSLIVPEDLRTAIVEITGLTSNDWLSPGMSFRDSFARLICSVTKGEVVLVDALLPELRAAGSDLFTRVAGQMDSIQSAISARSREIENAGYHAQVQPDEDERYTLFYEIESSGARAPLDSAERLAQLAREKPESISTAALMRPLLQDVVLAPRVFVGGPAEVAYYAQLGAVYQTLEVPQPRVALRAHTLVAPEKLIRQVRRYGIGPDEWLDSPEAILSRREHHREEELANRISALKEDFARELDEIRRSILRVDPSLTRSLNRTTRRIDYHLDTLNRRGRRAIARSDQERFVAIETLSNVLRPGGVVQDRTIGWLCYWRVWGDRFFESVVPFAEPGTDRLYIIGIS